MEQPKNNYYLFFELLATPLRMEIISLLKQGSMNVGSISTSLKEEQSKISHALRRLAECNVITMEKKGNFRYYSLNKKTIVPILEIIDKHVMTCCSVCRYLGRGKCSH